jgi:hypothetical protein
MAQTTKPPGPIDPGAFASRPVLLPGRSYFPASVFFASAAAFSRAVHGGVIALLRA